MEWEKANDMDEDKAKSGFLSQLKNWDLVIDLWEAIGKFWVAEW